MPLVDAFRTENGLAATAEPVRVWQCPSTKKLFDDRTEYKRHLRQLSNERNRERYIRRLHQVFEKAIAPLYELQDWNAVAQWLNVHSARVYSLYPPLVLEQDTRDKKNLKRKRKLPSVLTEFTCSDFRFGRLRRHYGERLDKRDPSRMIHSECWQGTLYFNTKGQWSRSDVRDMLNRMRFVTGSGGGTWTGAFNYDVTLWFDDWPTISLYSKLAGELDA